MKDVASAHYIETEGTLKDMGILIPNEWKSEVYTEEDEKRLGDCETVWNLNEDGFGEDGERLYNPDGTPCHQCRLRFIMIVFVWGVMRLNLILFLSLMMVVYLVAGRKHLGNLPIVANVSLHKDSFVEIAYTQGDILVHHVYICESFLFLLLD